ncbi:putative DD41D transposase [Trichonephila clavipes]|nr:putative DD41D transposase [Trichonephila clavipes]
MRVTGLTRAKPAPSHRCIHRQAYASQVTVTIFQHAQNTLNVPLSTRTITCQLLQVACSHRVRENCNLPHIKNVSICNVVHLMRRNGGYKHLLSDESLFCSSNGNHSLNFAQMKLFHFSLRGSGKSGRSPKGTSKNLVPELLPATAATNVEVRRFIEWVQNEIAVVPDFHKRILFSDEAHFWLNGYVNKQNCRIWSESNPQVYVETPLKTEKLTVWCALCARRIIDPYFFKNDEGHNVTVNGDRYRAMITNFFIPELNNHDVQELWFQQDGATCHTARATIDLLKDTFGDRLISRFGPVNWPPDLVI